MYLIVVGITPLKRCLYYPGSRVLGSRDQGFQDRLGVEGSRVVEGSRGRGSPRGRGSGSRVEGRGSLRGQGSKVSGSRVPIVSKY